MFHHSKDGRAYWRFWWHLKHFEWRVEFSAWSTFCHLGLDVDDEGWTFRIALPPLALWISLDGAPGPGYHKLWKPKRKTTATWDGGREIWLTDEREFEISIHDWAIRLTPWGRKGEWHSKDPWWIRGVTLHIKDVLFGKERCTTTNGESFPVSIPMPEKSYRGLAVVQTREWRRPRWFTKRRTDVSVDMEEGIPFPGKGENSWDIGMDALWGFGCSSTKPEEVIAAGVRQALESRRKYGGSVGWVPASEPASEGSPG